MMYKLGLDKCLKNAENDYYNRSLQEKRRLIEIRNHIKKTIDDNEYDGGLYIGLQKSFWFGKLYWKNVSL